MDDVIRRRALVHGSVQGVGFRFSTEGEADRLDVGGFVRNLPDDLQSTAIVRFSVDLGRTLGLHVVGEGVETVEVADALKASGCDLGQGYLWARPMPPEQVHGWAVERGGHGGDGVAHHGHEHAGTGGTR